MNSIGPECQDLKQKYDQCFNTWFTESFLSGKKTPDPCSKLFSEYQKCVKNAIKQRGIDLPDIDTPILGSSQEKQPPQDKRK